VGVNGSRIKFFARIDLCPKNKPWATSMLDGDECTLQQRKNDPNRITNPAEGECDQSDLRLAHYAQNSDRRLS
jgi:hypothetical protein